MWWRRKTPLTFPIRSRSPTKPSTTTPNTRGDAHQRRDPRPVEQRRRDQDRETRGAESFNGWVRRFGFGAPHRRRTAGRGKGRGAPLTTTPAPRWATCRSVRASSSHRCRWRARIRRSPTAGSCAHRTSWPDGRPPPGAAGRARVISAKRPRRRSVMMLEGVLAPGGTASEVSIPGYHLAGKTGTASTGRSADRRILSENRLHRLHLSDFAPASDPKLLCAVIVDEPNAGSIFGGTVAAPAFRPDHVASRCPTCASRPDSIPRMRLDELTAGLAGGASPATVQPRADVLITGLAYDSRSVRAGDLFFCVRGFAGDGHEYAPRPSTPARAGRRAAGVELGVPEVLVEDVRAAMGPLAARFHGALVQRRFGLGGWACWRKADRRAAGRLAVPCPPCAVRRRARARPTGASRRGSFWGRLAFIGKPVCGSVRVAFSSGVGGIFTLRLGMVQTCSLSSVNGQGKNFG